MEKMLVKEFQEFLNKDNPWDPAWEDGSISKWEESSPNHLIDDLIQVFSFENIDKSTDTQKKELIQRILKLGINNYTCEDLWRDLLKIDYEDNDLKHY